MDMWAGNAKGRRVGWATEAKLRQNHQKNQQKTTRELFSQPRFHDHASFLIKLAIFTSDDDCRSVPMHCKPTGHWRRRSTSQVSMWILYKSNYLREEMLERANDHAVRLFCVTRTIRVDNPIKGIRSCENLRAPYVHFCCKCTFDKTKLSLMA